MSQCPICNDPTEPNEQYPKAVCSSCRNRATTPDGERVVFSNEGVSGGFLAAARNGGDTISTKEPFDCLIDGVACQAEQGYQGGIVVRTV